MCFLYSLRSLHWLGSKKENTIIFGRWGETTKGRRGVLSSIIHYLFELMLIVCVSLSGLWKFASLTRRNNESMTICCWYGHICQLSLGLSPPTHSLTRISCGANKKSHPKFPHNYNGNAAPGLLPTQTRTESNSNLNRNELKPAQEKRGKRESELRARTLCGRRKWGRHVAEVVTSVLALCQLRMLPNTDTKAHERTNRAPTPTNRSTTWTSVEIGIFIQNNAPAATGM